MATAKQARPSERSAREPAREYQPNSEAGQALIGHELAHVVQQRGGRVSASGQGKGAPIVDDHALEREADEQGAKAARGERVDARAVGGVGGGVVQRKKAGND